MSLGRPLKPLTLQPEEQTKLELMARRPKTDQRTAQRARIVLDCAAGLSNTAVAAKARSIPFILDCLLSRVARRRQKCKTGAIPGTRSGPVR